jgi:hypothetical protein
MSQRSMCNLAPSAACLTLATQPRLDVNRGAKAASSTLSFALGTLLEMRYANKAKTEMAAEVKVLGAGSLSAPAPRKLKRNTKYLSLASRAANCKRATLGTFVICAQNVTGSSL